MVLDREEEAKRMMNPGYGQQQAYGNDMAGYGGAGGGMAAQQYQDQAVFA